MWAALRQGSTATFFMLGWNLFGFLYATLEETSTRIVFLAVLPEYRRRGIGTALHQELKAYIPREVAFVGVYAVLGSPVIPFFEKIGYLPGKKYVSVDGSLRVTSRGPASAGPPPSSGFIPLSAI